MSFQSLKFLVFLTITVALCLAVGRKKQVAGKTCLLLCSLLFCFQSKGFLVLGAGVAVSALAVRYLTSGKSENGRKKVLTAACLWHIAVLCAFKYLPFGWSPVGISFFTFQQVWLLKETYTRQFRPNTTEDLLLHAAFFPCLTSGPILRPGNFFPQLHSTCFLRPDWQDISAGLYAICIGMAKKMLLADPIGGIVDNGWAMVDTLSAPAAWLVILGYTLQLYLDFSGYCDIATGIARLLGIRLPANFNSPYHARSVTDFWKRWHITLTTFLRECVYFPLGGSRKGSGRAYANILIVFLISGIWHGTGWTFLIWGALHGLAQIAERALGNRRAHLPTWAQWCLTFLFVNFAWVFFRAPDLSSATALFSSAVSGGWSLSLSALTAGVLDSEVTAITTLLPMLTHYMPALLTAALLAIGMTVILWPQNTLEKMDTFKPRAAHGVLLAVLMVWAVLSFSSEATFIYSNF